jgi:hypothetical protein
MASIKLTGDSSGVITVSAPAAAGTNTITLPATTGTMALTSGLTTLNASNLTSGTVPDARFPATLPAINGSALTGIASGRTANNKIINGDFGVNQRAVSGTVSLSGGVYGHDRWKAGSGGATYTFATSANVTTITITAGTLQQVIEGNNLQSGTHTLSWTGTAQGKIGGGSFAATGVTGTATGGTNLTVEFNTGTVTKVQLEAGSTASAFEYLQLQQQYANCQRYYQTLMDCNQGYVNAGQHVGGRSQFNTEMRANPTITSVTLESGNVNNSYVYHRQSSNSFGYYHSASAAGNYYWYAVFTMSAEI